jgi:ribonuclease R
LSEGRVEPRGRRRDGARSDAAKVKPNVQAKAQPGRSPRRKDRKPGKTKPGKSRKGQSWKP